MASLWSVDVSQNPKQKIIKASTHQTETESIHFLVPGKRHSCESTGRVTSQVTSGFQVIKLLSQRPPKRYCCKRLLLQHIPIYSSAVAASQPMKFTANTFAAVWALMCGLLKRKSPPLQRSVCFSVEISSKLQFENILTRHFIIVVFVIVRLSSSTAAATATSHNVVSDKSRLKENKTQAY